MSFIIGADIGGSHISCGAVDPQTHALDEESLSHSSVDSQADLQDIITSWSQALSMVINRHGVRELKGIGIAMPGPFDYEKGIALFEGLNGKFSKLKGKPIQELIRQQLQLPASIPIRFINDATAYAIGEAIAGKTQAYTRSIALTIGTGLGSAFIDQTRPVVNDERVPAHGCLWYLPFGEVAVEDYFSTRGLVNRYQQVSGKEVAGLKEVAEKAPTDKEAREVLEDYGVQLATCLKPWLQSFAPEGLVIGGNGSRAYPFFGPAMRQAMHAMGSPCEVVTTTLFEQAALIGASKLIDPTYVPAISPLLKHLK